MAVGFDDIPFAIYPDGDGYLPLPVGPENANAPRTYTATARLTSGTDVSNLRALRTIVTEVPAMGFTDGGTLVIEAGAGVRDLVYPGANGEETTVDAILVSISPVAHLVSDDRRVELTFLVVE